MFDRFINVLTVAIVLLSIGVLGVSLHNEYTSVAYLYNISDAKPWEKYDEVMVIEERVASAEEIKSAISKALKAGAENDAKQLSRHYSRSYRSDGTRRTRFNSMDWLSPFQYAGFFLVFLVVPLTVNYIRHGKPKLWNGNTLNKLGKQESATDITS